MSWGRKLAPNGSAWGLALLVIMGWNWPAMAQRGCVPNPNLGGFPFIDGCSVPAAGLNKAFGNLQFICPPLTAYGGKGDGIFDNVPAWNKAIASNSCIGIPIGKFLFSGPIAATADANGKTITIVGVSPDASSMFWPAGGGLRINGIAARTAFHIHDLTVLTGAGNAGIGIDIDWGTQHNNNMASSTIDRVRVSGDVVGSGHYWQTGIRIRGVSAVNINSLDVFGPSGGTDPTTSTDLLIGGDTGANFGFIFNIINSNFLGAFKGLDYEADEQGVTIVNTNFTLNHYGIYVGPTTGSGNQSQLAVINSQFDNWGDNVLVDTGSTLAQLMFMNNLFFLLPNTAGINIKAGGYNQVIGNQFDTTTAALVTAQGLRVSNPGNNVAAENLCVLLSACVQLDAGASGWGVRATSIAGGAGENAVVNNTALGSANYIIGFIDPSHAFFPNALSFTGAASFTDSLCSNCIAVTTLPGASLFVVGQVVLLTAPGLANQPALYRIYSIPDDAHMIFAGSIYSGALIGSGTVSAQP